MDGCVTVCNTYRTIQDREGVRDWMLMPVDVSLRDLSVGLHTKPQQLQRKVQSARIKLKPEKQPIFWKAAEHARNYAIRNES